MGERRSEAAPAYATERNPARETLGGRDAKVASHLGTPLIPWQQHAADVFGEVDPATGDPWYREWCLVVQRQAGKTTLVRARLTRKCITKKHARVRYTAQTQLAAEERLEHDFWRPLSESPLSVFLNQRVGRRSGRIGYDGSTGAPAIAFANGSLWGTSAAKATAGHGPTLDDGMIDEAFAHQDASIESAMRPAMLTISDAQLGVASAAGFAGSVYLLNKVKAMREMVALENSRPISERRSRIAYIEYAAPLDADPDDPETYWRHHPAVGWLTTVERIQAARQGHVLAGEPEEADRAYLSWWPAQKRPDPVIPVASWNDVGLDAETVDWRDEPMWAIDVAIDRSRTSIGLAGDLGEAGQWLEVPASEEGTGWAVSHLVQLRATFGGNQVAIDAAGGAGAFEAALKQEGFKVIRLGAAEIRDACGGLQDAVLDREAWHGRDATLTNAMLSAAKKTTDGAFVWTRGKSLGDITPLYAVTLARHAFLNHRRPRYEIDDSILDPEDGLANDDEEV